MFSLVKSCKDFRVITYFYYPKEKDVYCTKYRVYINLRIRKLINGVYIQMAKHSLK